MISLLEDGVQLEDIDRAITHDDLGMLAFQRALATTAQRYTLADIAARTDTDPDRITRWFRALERPVAENTDERAYTAEDLGIIERLRDYAALGVTDDDLLPAARAVGRGLAQMAEAIASVVAGPALDRGLPSTSGPDPARALRYALEARRIAAHDGLRLSHLLALAVTQRVGSHVVAAGAGTSVELRGTQQVAVGFADIVGFTDLGTRVNPLVLAELADMLITITHEISVSPTRLTKTIGDAVMLVSPDPDALLRTVVALAARWQARNGPAPLTSVRPALRIGVAWGRAIAHAGDWFGEPVNLASRITAAATPGTVLVAAELRTVSRAERFRWTTVSARRFKGIAEPQQLLTVEDAPQTWGDAEQS